jgi:hypothetical protein
MTTITITCPAPVAAPRGALWAAEIAARLLAGFGALVERVREYNAMARRVDEAAAVRRLAADWEMRDHRVAADLYAVADRHERGF